MKSSIIYTSDDGTVFSDQAKCVEYETLCGRVEAAMKNLLSRPNDNDFGNGSGFIQHSLESYAAAKSQFLDIVSEVIKDPCVYRARTQPATHSILGRFIDDGGPGCFRAAWLRFMCIDENCREWGQPYFAINPGKGKQVRLNP